jgi:hypothetical protein
VSFHNGSTLLGTGTVNGSGVAIFSTTTLPVGTDSITAGYSGNAGFAGSTSTAISVQVNAANAAATVTAVASSNLAPTYGQSVTLTATVTPVPTAAPPGSIKFYAGTALLGAQAINAQGIATLSLSLPLGPNAITAVYSGSAGFAASTSSSLSVSARALSAITFSASPTTQLATMPVVFTAQVNSTTAGAQTGTVSFLNGSTVLATVTIVASQPAVYSETGLSSGLYSVTASYSGDGSFLPSASTGAPISITVSDLDLAIGGDKNKTVVPGGAVTYNFPLSLYPPCSRLRSSITWRSRRRGCLQAQPTRSRLQAYLPAAGRFPSPSRCRPPRQPRCCIAQRGLHEARGSPWPSACCFRGQVQSASAHG